jgi:hypothetical protein
MANDSNLQSDVLHNENHSTLSAEEIAKAVARHAKHHPEGKAEKKENVKGKGKAGAGGQH